LPLPANSKPLVAFLTGATLLIVALVVLVSLSSVKDEEWRTYDNHTFDYEIDYPASWELTLRDPQPGEKPPTQLVQLSNGKDSVLVTVNLPSPMCPAPMRREVERVNADGTSADQFECPTGPTTANQIVRDLGQVARDTSITVLGQPNGNAGTVRRIIESFRLIE
jgi:hypothetical protein